MPMKTSIFIVISILTGSYAIAQTQEPESPVLIVNPECGSKVIGYTGTPAANEVWYWQGTACGTSVDFSGSTFQCNTSGTYYLRAYNTSTTEWSASCSSIDVVVNGSENSTVSGTVTIGSDPCINCKLLVYKHSGANGIVWDKVDSVQTDANGYYERELPGISTFVVCARPETGGYINCAPTYAGNIHRWGPAQQIVAQCDMNYTSDIAVVTFPQRTGVCTLSGQIRQINTGKTLEEDPIPLIDVVIERTPPGSISGMTQTDQNGEFTFDLVEADASPYLIRVSIPGLPMIDPLLIPVTPGDLGYMNLDYCIDFDTTYISPCLSVGTPTPLRAEKMEAMAVPNPSVGDFTITGILNGASTIKVCDVIGREIWKQSFMFDGAFSVPVNLVNHPKGLYYVSIGANNETKCIKLIIE